MAGHRLWTPSRRDMIWIDCDPQAGREMKDIHPLLVLSPRSWFSQPTEFDDLELR